jgi:hypothetical protein
MSKNGILFPLCKIGIWCCINAIFSVSYIKSSIFYLPKKEAGMTIGIVGWGAISFGLVIGWITYRTILFREEQAELADIATVIGAVGGAAVTALFKSEMLFGAYCIGLAVGFFAFLIVRNIKTGKDKDGNTIYLIMNKDR